MADFRVETDRLALRGWRSEDAEPLYAMGQDARVMEWLGPPISREDASKAVAGQILNQSLFGHCFWAVEHRADGVFIGFCGLNPGPVATPLEGKIEIGWRLAHKAWGHGFAREAAEASFDWGFTNLPCDAIYAITVLGNSRSWRLMERLGMTRCHDMDFAHPNVPDDSPLKQHVTYELKRPA